MWEEIRTVTKTATVSLSGNRYEVDAHLVGRKVALRFDPFDLSLIDVFYQGTSFGQAKPYSLKRAAHPSAKKEIELPKIEKSGINYLELIRAEHQASFKREIPYRKFVNESEEPADV